MYVMPERWNDDKMDALSARVDDLGGQMEKGFKRIDAELREQRQETKAEFAAVRSEMKADAAVLRDEIKAESAALRGEMTTTTATLRNEMTATTTALRGEMSEGFSRIDGRLERMHLLMLQLFGSFIVALIGLFGVLVVKL